MKRAILSTVVGVLAACSAEPPERDSRGPEATREWTRPPVIERVTLADAVLVVVGVAEPQSRVVLRSDDGAAFAVSADIRGRFEIRVPGPTGRLLLRPETQMGQDAAPSPDRLLVLPGAGPIVVLRPGAPTRRLDAAAVLGAVDSDGRMRLASGRARPGTASVEVQSGGETVQVQPDEDGRWSVMLSPADGPALVRVDGREFLWPGEGTVTRDLTVERAGSGWRILWTGPGGARQTTWLPDPTGA